MKITNRFIIFFIFGFFLSVLLFSSERITIFKVINDENIIISKNNGEHLLLKKWSLRFSPLSFEGKSFLADISPIWVTIYIEGRDPIKWEIKETLGFGSSSVDKNRKLSSTAPLAREVLLLVQAALSLLGYNADDYAGSIEDKLKAAVFAFQSKENITLNENIGQDTMRILSIRLYRKFPSDRRVLEIADNLLSAAFKVNKLEESHSEEQDIIESYIKGDFEGWDGDTIFILDNGQIWQQSSYAYTYRYSFHPKVTILKIGDLYKLIVERVNSSIYVKRIK